MMVIDNQPKKRKTMKKPFVLWMLILSLGIVDRVSADVPAEVDRFSLKLNQASYSQWRNHILPEAGELDFEKIPWLATFKDGILASEAEQRPLLLWVMNGHPLGCT